MSKIFLSYRRKDSADATGRLADRLTSLFGESSVFLDIEDDRKGYDFNEYIQREISNAQIILVVIGKHWLGNDEEARRIDNPKDNVRIEVELALASGRPVIPVLVDGAIMPAKEELPTSIAALSTRSGIELTAGSGFEGQFEKLKRAMRKELSLGRRILLCRAGWLTYATIAALAVAIASAIPYSAFKVNSTMQSVAASCSSQVVLLCANGQESVFNFASLPVVASIQRSASEQAIELMPSNKKLSGSDVQKFVPKVCFDVEGEKQCLTHPLRPGDYHIQLSLEDPLGLLWKQSHQDALNCTVAKVGDYYEEAKCE